MDTILIAYSCYELAMYTDSLLNEDEVDPDERRKGELKFPENPEDLLSELPRDPRGNIKTADNVSIRPEKHDMKPGETYNPRHHGQHYHVETRRDPSKSNWKSENVEIIIPHNYYDGMGTGFLPVEVFPGVI